MNNAFDWFVIPFAVGFYGLMIYMIYTVWNWSKSFTKADKHNISKNVFSFKTIAAIKEIVSESLLHRKVFKVNFRLGWMHMTFAMGWLLLIVVGKLQITAYSGDWLNHVWYSVFFRYFEPTEVVFKSSRLFAFLMDAILLFILTGVAMAWIKRVRSKLMGMKQTTKQASIDKLALTLIWMIFPLRLIAESITCGAYGGGSFLTGSLGKLLALGLPVNAMFYPAWWAYSTVLGLFFITLPFSRYMHIPSEIVLILFRKWGVSKESLTAVEVASCSRCGICIDGCAMAVAGVKSQAVYAVRQVREEMETADMTHACMSCGSCEQRCPVGINLNDIRLKVKKAKAPMIPVDLPSKTAAITLQKSSIVYIPGCIGKLTPAITNAMHQIFKNAGIDFVELGSGEEFCCGRPLLLAGKVDDAKRIVDRNSDILKALKPSAIVTSCPVCFKMFNENYQLNVDVLHHTQFIDKLIDLHHIELNPINERMIYHDPCELGRGSGVYDAPRNILKKSGKLLSSSFEKEKSLCCGGSLGAYTIDDEKRVKIARFTVDELESQKPDQIITACSMCKRSLAQFSGVKVRDIAEVVANQMIVSKKTVGKSEIYQRTMA